MGARRCVVLAPIVAVVVAGLVLLGAAPKGEAPAAPKEGAAEKEPKARVLEISVSGSIEEQPQVTLPFGPRERLLRDYTASIRKAAQDAAIKAIILRLSLPQTGLAGVQELADAIAEFRATGKKVYCYFQTCTNRDYLLACSADRIVAPPEGMLLLTGISAEALFFRRLLDWAGIRADFLFFGKHKRAAEPFTSTSMSEENRKVLNELIDDLYEQLVDAIAKGRKLTAEAVRQAIDRGPYSAREAQQAKLVDDVAYYDEFVAAIGAELGAKVDLVKQYHRLGGQRADLSEFNIFNLFASLRPQPDIPANNRPKIVILYASGMIVFSGMSSLFSNAITAEQLGKALESARKDPTVKAVVLRIDSPGGSALVSDLIWHEVERTRKAGKIVIASMAGVAASGGYYIAMNADAIVAQPGTLTGSIGVIGGKLVFRDLYKKIGIDTETFSRGKNATVFSTGSEFTDAERERLKALMGGTYEGFVKKAAEGRKLPLEKMRELATGRVWTGRAAKAIGLVDALGGLKEAYDLALAKTGLQDQDVQPVILPRERNFLEVLFDAGAQTRAALPLAFSSLPFPLAEPVRRTLPYAAVVELLARENVLLMMPYHIELR